MNRLPERLLTTLDIFTVVILAKLTRKGLFSSQEESRSSSSLLVERI